MRLVTIKELCIDECMKPFQNHIGPHAAAAASLFRSCQRKESRQCVIFGEINVQMTRKD